MMQSPEKSLVSFEMLTKETIEQVEVLVGVLLIRKGT